LAIRRSHPGWEIERGLASSGGMGVSVHFQGSLGGTVRLTDLVDELDDIARSMDWQSHRIERDAENPEIAGIIMEPADYTESLPFLFDRAGRLRCLADLICGQIEPDPRCSYFVSVKTQFGDVGSHLWIVGLLRYLKSKYLPDLAVNDEGGYWETGDAAELTRRRDFLSEKIAELTDGLSTMKGEGKTAEELAAEIEAFFERQSKDFE
jgi:hypothetical protein